MPRFLPFLQDSDSAPSRCFPCSLHTPKTQILALLTLLLPKPPTASMLPNPTEILRWPFSAHHSLLLVTTSSQISMTPWAMKHLLAKGNFLKRIELSPVINLHPGQLGEQGSLLPDRGTWAVSTTCLKLSRSKTKLIWS